MYVDSVPLGDGDMINDELPVVNGEIPLPDWSVFASEDFVDLSDKLRRAPGDGDPRARGGGDRSPDAARPAPPRRADHGDHLRVPGRHAA